MKKDGENLDIKLAWNSFCRMQQLDFDVLVHLSTVPTADIKRIACDPSDEITADDMARVYMIKRAFLQITQRMLRALEEVVMSTIDPHHIEYGYDWAGNGKPIEHPVLKEARGYIGDLQTSVTKAVLRFDKILNDIDESKNKTQTIKKTRKK